ncbi:MAG: polymerase, partial [Rhodospirillales bacterium]|nr:polymerase [Rhodospirillales bacterium]
PEYKAHRPPPPEELIPQFALTRDAVRAMCVACIEKEGFEADDIIATYARLAVEAGADVTIVSSDKDLMQLVGPRVKMFDAMRNRIIGDAEVREKFGVGPDHVVDVQALAGDSTDNVPGVSSIGIKTAAQLINEFGDLDTLLARVDEVKKPKCKQMLIEQRDRALISRDLVKLCNTVPQLEPLTDLKKQEPDHDKMAKFLREQAFKSLLARFEQRHGASLAKSAAARIAVGETTNAETTTVTTTVVTTSVTTTTAAEIPTAVSFDKYELVQNEERLAAWIADAREAGLVAFDTETNSLDPMRADLIGLSLGLAGGRACYVPLAHRAAAAQGSFDLGGGEAPHISESEIKQIARERAVQLIKPLLEDPTILKIGQNIKFDMEVLARYGVRIAPIDDTMIMSYVLEGGAHGHGMDELSELHLGHTTIKFKDVCGTGKNQITFDLVALDKARDYAAEDADVTYRLYDALKPRLVEQHMVGVYETLERPLINVLTDMEEAGIKVDAALLRSLSDDFERRCGELEEGIHKLAGHPFNVGSPKQLGEVLFDEMGLPGGKKGKTGAYATGADVLDELAAQGHELPARLLEWRQLAKLKSTYTDALIGQIDPKTGRVHTCYSQAIASTGRLSSNDPNLQNIPIRTEEGRKIRKAFVPEAGHVLMSADYSQIELRLLAHVAKIDPLIKAFHDGADIHAMTASQVFGIPVEGMDPMVRRQAKAINFGIIYGISAFGLARQLGIGRGEAQAYIDAYFQKYPGIRAYMDTTKELARGQGFVTTLYGRKCHVTGINDRNPAMRNFAERAAINAPIQGGAADIIKRAMIRMPGALQKAGLKTRMLLQVHDELVFEVPRAEIDAAKTLTRTVMEQVAHLDVPLVVDTGIGQNWDEAH